MGPTAAEIETILSQLTTAEKISLLAGASTWRTAAIERLGVPPLKVSDGPSGARGEIFGESHPAAFLPCGVSLGATWDTDLLFEIGELLAEETKSKSASVLLAPTMCMHRHPLGGRNFESFSEDPFLTGKLATAHVRGLQSHGIGATPKHYVANEQETNRFHYDAVIAPRPLREIYLLPFQMVVRDADPWCMMTGYNKVNGKHCDTSNELLIDIPRDEWGWKGLFMSDWGATNSVGPSLDGGLDLEMPGPPNKRTLDNIETHLQQHPESMERITDSARRMLHLLAKAGRFEDASDDAEKCLNLPEQRAKLLEAASGGVVLLKNADAALPLKPSDDIKKLAILGPNAKRVVAGGGGSSYINAPYWTSVYNSLSDRFGETGTEILHSVGAKVNRYVPTVPLGVLRNPDKSIPGAVLDWHSSHDTESEVVAQTHIEDLYYICFGNTPPGIGETDFVFRLRTILSPLTTGRHKMSLASIGPTQLFVDDKLVIDLPGEFNEDATLFFTYGSEEVIVEMDMVAGQEYKVDILCHSHDRQLDPNLVPRMRPMEDKFNGLRLGFEEYNPADLPTEAVALAKECDAAVIVVGRDKEWETEGHDIPIFELPGEQVRLIEEVSAVCPRTIVVVQAGTPVQMEPWLHRVQAVLYSWYQGQELGNASAAVICGEFNPSGRLPITFPRRLEDCPAFSSFPGEQGDSLYAEGLYVGYRWWDLIDIAPLFPLGYGLSYSRFEILPGSVAPSSLSKDTVLRITAQVENIGGSDLPGRETIIAWLSPTSNRGLSRPKKQICGFAKTQGLLPGEKQILEIEVDVYPFGVYDPRRGTWVVASNSTFDILIGTNALDVKSVGSINVPEEISWLHRV